MKQTTGLLGPSLLAGACGIGLLLIGQVAGLFLVIPGLLGVALHVINGRERRPVDDDEAEDMARLALLEDVLRADAEAKAKESP